MVSYDENPHQTKRKVVDNNQHVDPSPSELSSVCKLVLHFTKSNLVPGFSLKYVIFEKIIAADKNHRNKTKYHRKYKKNGRFITNSENEVPFGTHNQNNDLFKSGQRTCVESIGFGSALTMQLEKLLHEICYWVVDNHDPTNNFLRIKDQ